MNDLIDRRAAIDAVKNTDVVVLYHDTEPVEEAIEEAIEATKRSITTGIEGLPSAQPETVRCKDCKFQDKGCNEAESWNLCGYRPWLHVPTEDEHYCGYAVRKENR